MDIFSELREKKYYGHYRAQIVEVNDKKNGIYKVRTYPHTASLEDKDLPQALSNLTNKYSHISLNVDDWVWVFYENGNPRYPMIFDLCNVKDSYPKQCSGDKPNYYDDIKQDNSIDEGKVSYNGEYNKIQGINFKDINIEIDEENNQFILISPNWQIIFDKDKAGHLSVKNLFIKSEEAFNMNINNNIIKINNDGINIKDKNNNEIVIDNKGINIKSVTGSELDLGALIKLKNNAGSLQGVLQDIQTDLQNLASTTSTASTSGSPFSHTVIPGPFIPIINNIVANITKMNTIFTQ